MITKTVDDKITETNHKSHGFETTSPQDGGVGLTLSNHGTIADQSQHARTFHDSTKPLVGKMSEPQPKIEHETETQKKGLSDEGSNPESKQDKLQPDTTHQHHNQQTHSQTQSNGAQLEKELRSDKVSPEDQTQTKTVSEGPPKAATPRNVVRKNTYYSWEMKLAADGDSRLSSSMSRKFKEHIVQNFQNLQEVAQARNTEQPIGVPLKPVLPKDLGSSSLIQTSQRCCWSWT